MKINCFSKHESFFNCLLNRAFPNPSRYINGQRIVIQDIPQELILEIFSQLSITHLVPLRLVDKQWKILVEQSLARMPREIIIKEIVLRGKFKNDRLDHGQMVFPNGIKWEGKFKDGFLIQGKVTQVDGTIVEGEFKNGFLIQGKIIRAEGSIMCEGEFQSDREQEG